MLARVGVGAFRALMVLSLVLSGCHSMTEEEALEGAREEIRQEMRPEVERRQKEINNLKRQIEETRARLSSRQRPPQRQAPSP